MGATFQDLTNALRFLAIDAVNQAKSGHPGMPMGMADVATVLFRDFLNFNPDDPVWPGRDRFVLSAGHGSMLLYALLHLTGYHDFSMSELQRFRQLHARTAGHPEYGMGGGIEMTTGPLGQGLATSVGMALAERMMNNRFGNALISHYTYVIASDGDLMEGISHEAITMAGHWQLGRLIVLYDDNNISIDGNVSISDSTDTLARFTAAGWDVCRIDGHDPQQIAEALTQAQKTDKPSLIACRTVIGYGSPSCANTASVHGAPLGEEEAEKTRGALGWPYKPFEIPVTVQEAWRGFARRGRQRYQQWQTAVEASGRRRQEFERFLKGDIQESVQKAVQAFKKTQISGAAAVATRVSSQKVLTSLVPEINAIVGGSADLTGSNNTFVKPMRAVSKDDFGGNYLHYGVREHGMAACMNGLALYGGFVPYGGTFLVFSDYMRPAMRLAALMKQRVIYVLTHDSIGLGEDGPTHQPIEHLSALRAIPGLQVLRPADSIETAECWQMALNYQGPSVLALSRQALPLLRGHLNGPANLSERGAYVLQAVPDGLSPQAVLLASGSELALAVQAQALLAQQEIGVSVVSCPGLDRFLRMDAAYQRELCPDNLVRVAIEAGSVQSWYPVMSDPHAFIGMDSFGESAPASVLYQHFGITAEAIVNKVLERL